MSANRRLACFFVGIALSIPIGANWPMVIAAYNSGALF